MGFSAKSRAVGRTGTRSLSTREIHLCGSIPLASAGEAFATIADRPGGAVRPRSRRRAAELLPLPQGRHRHRMRLRPQAGGNRRAVARHPRRARRSLKGTGLPKLTTGEAIAKSLVLHGVDTVFGIPGAHMYHFTDALARESNRIRFVTTRHEQGAGHMAFGYAKSTGRVGVYTVVPGPGVLNSSSALSVAYGASAPVLCVTGNVMSHLIGRGRGQLHELPDQLATLPRLHRLCRAHRPPDRGARDRRPRVPGNARRTGAAGGGRGAVGRVRPGRRSRARHRPLAARPADAGPGRGRGGGEADPRRPQPADRGRRAAPSTPPRRSRRWPN